MKKSLKTFIILSVLSLTVFSTFIINVRADDTYTNYDKNAAVVSCGNLKNIPSLLPEVLSIVYVVIQVAIPIVLVILGLMDLFKAVSSNKEDEMKKAQGMFVKRLVAAVLVFFVFAVVKLVISVAAKDSDGLFKCMDCFIKGTDYCDKIDK